MAIIHSTKRALSLEPMNARFQADPSLIRQRRCDLNTPSEP